jgi:hypothetical protein
MKSADNNHTFEFLSIFYDKMIEEGKRYHIFSIDDNFLSLLNKKLGATFDLKYAKELADICIANEWVKRTTMGEKYNNLEITTTGLGIVKSKIRRIQELKQKSILKKIADYIDDHKGIFVLLSFLVSILSLIVSGIALVFNINKGP